MHALETLFSKRPKTLFSKCSLQFPIVSNTVTLHFLVTLVLKGSLKLQIVSNCVSTLFSKTSLQSKISF